MEKKPNWRESVIKVSGNKAKQEYVCHVCNPPCRIILGISDDAPTQCKGGTP